MSIFTRRQLAQLALGSAAALHAKPNSNFGGVQIGVITYSFRALNASADDTLKYILDCGLSGIELMSNVAEEFAGAPKAPRGSRIPAEEMKKWRLSVPMSKYKEFRKKYNDAGVKIYAFKLPPTMAMDDSEYEYIWNAAEMLGANHVTMELPNDDALLQRTAEYAAKRKIKIGYHTHGQGGASFFDKALAASKYTALNFDIGHYYGVTGESPIPVMIKYADRISSLHLKDRKGPTKVNTGGLQGPGGGGPNMPWGQGETPLKELLQTMKKQKFKFPASIEYEYNTPQGSDPLTEIKKCVQFCKDALA